jgi:hypothetical protein
MLTFRAMATIACVICFALAAVWLFFPGWQLSQWDVAYSNAAGLVSRRLGGLFLGIGVLMLFARGAGPSASRDGIGYGFAVGCLTLAGLGVFEWASGNASAGIFLAVVVEIALAAGFLTSLQRDAISTRETR